MDWSYRNLFWLIDWLIDVGRWPPGCLQLFTPPAPSVDHPYNKCCSLYRLSVGVEWTDFLHAVNKLKGIGIFNNLSGNSSNFSTNSSNCCCCGRKIMSTGLWKFVMVDSLCLIDFAFCMIVVWLAMKLQLHHGVFNISMHIKNCNYITVCLMSACT